MTAPFNSLLLLSAKPGLDQSLAIIGREIEKFFAADRDVQAIFAALDELQRVIGVLQKVPMRGLVVFCSQLEILMKELSASSQNDSAMSHDAIRHALFGLTHYLNAVSAGAPNATLRLFREYQELHQARGLDMAFELDLFYPNLQVDLPESLLNEPQQIDAASRIKNERMLYQQNLLKWLRQDNPAEALRGMMASVRVVLTCVAQDHQRSFWWVAGGLLNCILHDGVPSELSVKKSLSRIDQRMRALLDNKEFDEQEALSEMLYLVARSHTVSETVQNIKRTFELDAYLPQESPLQAKETTTVLENMRVQLALAEEAWEHAVSGDAAACSKFIGLAEQLYLLSETLDRDTLQFLCKQIHATARHADEPQLAQKLATDMAMALLLLRTGIDRYQNLDGGFHEQVRLLNLRLQDALTFKPEDAAKLANLVSLYCAMQQREVLVPLAFEMQTNLRQIEQALPSFCDDNNRTELPRINALLAQVQGGLHILSLDAAEQLLAAVQRITENCQLGGTPSPQETRAVKTALTALQNYLHGLSLGYQPEQTLLSEVLNEFIATPDDAAQMAVTATEPATSASVSIRSGEEDAELLDVFLEEAQEVMQTLLSSLEEARRQPDSREPLVTIRRAFHTLKGSGRMVGLTELGEAAWAVERAMNKWLAENKPASPALLELVGEAESLFRHWVDMLRSGSTTAQIDAQNLLALADRIENGQDSSQSALTPPTVVAEPAIIASVPAEESTVAIGSVSISAELFRIASEEAAEHMLDLQRHHARLQDDAAHIVSHDFMRAAHTLAGVNRTMGFTDIAGLANALEQWLDVRIDKQGVVNDTQLALLQEVINRLNEMCTAVRNRNEPPTDEALTARLLADKEVVTSTADTAPPVEPSEAPPAQAEVQPAALVERTVHDEVDQQLLPIFLEEAHELYPQIGSTLRAWRENPQDAQLGRNLQRSLHTLKGSSRMAGAMRLGELTHRVEGRVDVAISQNALDDNLWNELDGYLDRIAHAIEQLQNQQTTTTAAEPAQQFANKATQAIAAPTLEVGAERAMQAALLRVRSDMVDRLVNEAGEVSVARSRVETELLEFKNGVLELTDSVNRLRKQLREIEIQAESQMQARVTVSSDSADKFDPLEFDRFTRFQELTRFMNESVHDVQTLQQSLLKNLDEATDALITQSQLNRELQQGLMSIRMVPFSSIGERLYRIVRQTGKELGKRANLELSGTEIELDRSVLEKMTAPFEHLLRNSIAHGLETPEQREQSGKTPFGEIRLALRQESNEVVFEFSDDGAGLDIARIRQKALDSGIIGTDEEVSDEQIMQLIFRAGLSTAQEITEVSGRGVGMDVVRSEISALGGRIDVASDSGRGVKFSIHLPLTLAVTKTLMVRAGHTIYAIPSTMVENVQQLKPDQLEAIYKQQYVDWQGQRYGVHYLPRLLGDHQLEVIGQPHNPVLLLRSGDHRIALHVDALLGNREVVVKNIGPQLARLPGIAGATVSGSGVVILIINPVAFTQGLTVTHKAEISAAVEEVRAVPLIMVVDDSLTVRKITTRLLERAGYLVVTAKDGVDALEQLMEISPDLMLLDIEMPRMDGFELAKRLRQDSKTKALPIIMITSRTADKHRNFAMELGVNEYLGKPYHEEELLHHITRLLPSPI